MTCSARVHRGISRLISIFSGLFNDEMVLVSEELNKRAQQFNSKKKKGSQRIN